MNFFKIEIYYLKDEQSEILNKFIVKNVIDNINFENIIYKDIIIIYDVNNNKINIPNKVSNIKYNNIYILFKGEIISDLNIILNKKDFSEKLILLMDNFNKLFIIKNNKGKNFLIFVILRKTKIIYQGKFKLVIMDDFDAKMLKENEIFSFEKESEYLNKMEGFKNLKIFNLSNIYEIKEKIISIIYDKFKKDSIPIINYDDIMKKDNTIIFFIKDEIEQDENLILKDLPLNLITLFDKYIMKILFFINSIPPKMLEPQLSTNIIIKKKDDINEKKKRKHTKPKKNRRNKSIIINKKRSIDKGGINKIIKKPTKN